MSSKASPPPRTGSSLLSSPISDPAGPRPSPGQSAWTSSFSSSFSTSLSHIRLNNPTLLSSYSSRIPSNGGVTTAGLGSRRPASFLSAAFSGENVSPSMLDRKRKLLISSRDGGRAEESIGGAGDGRELKRGPKTACEKDMSSNKKRSGDVNTDTASNKHKRDTQNLHQNKTPKVSTDTGRRSDDTSPAKVSRRRSARLMNSPSPRAEAAKVSGEVQEETRDSKQSSLEKKPRSKGEEEQLSPSTSKTPSAARQKIGGHAEREKETTTSAQAGEEEIMVQRRRTLIKKAAKRAKEGFVLSGKALDAVVKENGYEVPWNTTCAPLTVEKEFMGGVLVLNPGSSFGPVDTQEGLTRLFVMGCQDGELVFESGLNGSRASVSQYTELLVAPFSVYALKNTSRREPARLLLMSNGVDGPFVPSKTLTEIKDTAAPL
ncbi:glutamic acid-rcih protein [Cystoisospora suis]|uniref:Glutamic acid-rcih protein n=1 Tax=Cystoisospora suis TaxID=483139 RepID=A0A2C6KUX1_9APIC|nr:glutamic acid-rcih protein [Cystoisospora suis]